LIKTLQHLWQLNRYLGAQWFLSRFLYAIKQRSGWLEKKTPISDWRLKRLSQFLTNAELRDPNRYFTYRKEAALQFFFNPSARIDYERVFRRWDTENKNPSSYANGIRDGEFNFFENTVLKCAFPPSWHKNPITGQTFPLNVHWSRIPDFERGDIKLVWETSRFSFVFALVRAYWRSGDEKYAEIFWLLVEDWQRNNPPNCGVHWKCGQEITFRIMAWCFGLYGFLDSAATTPERLTSLAQMIAVSGERIESNIAYALSQSNNHGMSEALGLWTIGLLFPELGSAGRWREKGRRHLEDQGKSLIYEDGSFSQHSVNYHRLMLHDYIWAIRLGELNGQPLSSELKSRIAKAGDFLYQIQDAESGHVPNYGQNDGALILPLDNCDFRDYRPVIQATESLCRGSRRYADGPWDEDLLWLFGPEALKAGVSSAQLKDLAAEVGGYYTLRSGKGFTFTRCGTLRHRPGQADMLHMDLWWRGVNVAIDPGTYSYNAPDPWNNPLAHTGYHNTVTVDGKDQMDRAGKFLWLPWVKGVVTENRRSTQENLACFEGDHDGYERLKQPVSYKRAIIRLGEETWLVLDYLDSRAPHLYRLHWLFNDFGYDWEEEKGRLDLKSEKGSYHVQIGALQGKGRYSLVRADPNGPRGWQAPSYYDRKPALSLSCEAQDDHLCFWTLFSPEESITSFEDSRFQIITDQLKAEVVLQNGRKASGAMVSSVHLHGKIEDELFI
jgi:hypothetical protein